MASKRYYVLDGIRGLALINMIAYHACWDLVYMFGMDWKWYKSEAAYVWQQGICWTFIFLSGFCWSMGGHHIKRGFTVFAGGAVISAVTFLAMPQNRVAFGVLTLIGSCMLIFSALDKILRKINSVAGLAISAVLFFFTRNVNQGYLGFESHNICRLPDALYKNMITAYIGFPYEGFFSTDYFSIIPWIFLFSAGYFLYRLAERGQMLFVFEKSIVAWLEWLGKYSFWIYMAHQPLIYAILLIALGSSME